MTPILRSLMLAACVGAAASGGVFKFVSSLHVEPAPGNETRGFHFVIAGPVTLWACGIRGELVAIDITNASVPAVVFDEQAPDPAGRAGLAHSRMLQWVGGGAPSAGPSAERFLLASGNLSLYDGADRRAPRRLASVPFPEAGFGASGSQRRRRVRHGA